MLIFLSSLFLSCYRQWFLPDHWSPSPSQHNIFTIECMRTKGAKCNDGCYFRFIIQYLFVSLIIVVDDRHSPLLSSNTRYNFLFESNSELQDQTIKVKMGIVKKSSSGLCWVLSFALHMSLHWLKLIANTRVQDCCQIVCALHEKVILCLMYWQLWLQKTWYFPLFNVSITESLPTELYPELKQKLPKLILVRSQSGDSHSHKTHFNQHLAQIG